jgi:hypothetical protein
VKRKNSRIGIDSGVKAGSFQRSKSQPTPEISYPGNVVFIQHRRSSTVLLEQMTLGTYGATQFLQNIYPLIGLDETTFDCRPDVFPQFARVWPFEVRKAGLADLKRPGFRYPAERYVR